MESTQERNHFERSLNAARMDRIESAKEISALALSARKSIAEAESEISAALSRAAGRRHVWVAAAILAAAVIIGATSAVLIGTSAA